MVDSEETSSELFSLLANGFLVAAAFFGGGGAGRDGGAVGFVALVVRVVGAGTADVLFLAELLVIVGIELEDKSDEPPKRKTRRHVIAPRAARRLLRRTRFLGYSHINSPSPAINASPPMSSLALPAYTVCFSLALFAVQAVLRSRPEQSKRVRQIPAIAVLNSLRAAGCTTLACISFWGVTSFGTSLAFVNPQSLLLLLSA